MIRSLTLSFDGGAASLIDAWCLEYNVTPAKAVGYALAAADRLNTDENIDTQCSEGVRLLQIKEVEFETGDIVEIRNQGDLALYGKVKRATTFGSFEIELTRNSAENFGAGLITVHGSDLHHL